MIETRIKLIPIDQKCPLKAVFELNAFNDSPACKDVYVSEFTIKSAHGLKLLPFNESFVLCTLEPGRYIRINSITIARGYAYNHASNTVAFNAALTALDIKPVDSEGNSVSSSAVRAETICLDIQY